MRRAVLLDALGTLLELDAPVPRLVGELRERHGIDVALPDAVRAVKAEMAHYRANLHRASDQARLAEVRRECGDVVARELGIEEDVTEALLAAIVFRPFDEVPDVLRRLRARGARLVVASNWDVSLDEALERTGLRTLVDGAVNSAVVGSAKPAPGVFLRALEIAGAEPGESMHVGDDVEADVEGARALGIEPVLVLRMGAPPLRGPGGRSPAWPCRTIRTLAELA